MALSAIQGLNQKVEDEARQLRARLEEKDVAIQDLKARNQSLEQRLEALEKALTR